MKVVCQGMDRPVICHHETSETTTIDWNEVRQQEQHKLLWKYIKEKIPLKLWKEKDYLDRTLLVYAVKFGDMRAVLQLIGAGIDVNQGSFFNHTPLLWALENKHVDILKVLVAAGATGCGSDKVDFTRYRYSCLGRQCIEVYLANGLGSYYFQFIRNQRGTISKWALEIDGGVKCCRMVILILLGLKKHRKIPDLLKLDRFLIKQCLAVEIWTTRLDKGWNNKN